MWVRRQAIDDMSVRERSEELFHLATEFCPVGIVLLDGQGRIILANVEMARQFGYAPDEMVGRLLDVFAPADPCLQRGERRASFVTDPEARARDPEPNLYVRRKNRSTFPVEVSFKTTGDLLVATVVDIRERLRMERLKDEFVATVSHELRTPLTSISGALGLLVNDAGGELPDPMRRLLSIAHGNSQRLVRLVNNILDMEKIESGKVVFALQKVELRALAERAIETMRALADTHGVRVTLDPAASARELRADPDWLVQVVTNLLSNAIKFSPRDAEVAVTIESRVERLRLSVRDHGHGVPDEFKPRIFEKFAQADATDARQQGGTGLGLSIVKEIVTRLGGEVGFSDAPEGGAIFFVELPAMPARSEEQER